MNWQSSEFAAYPLTEPRCPRASILSNLVVISWKINEPIASRVWQWRIMPSALLARLLPRRCLLS